MTDIRKLLKERILLLDGAMGTALQAYNLTAQDFGGDIYEGCNEYLNLVRPGIVQEIHEGYLEAGSDIIETNTFGGTTVTLSEFELADKDYEINLAAAKIARVAVDKYSNSDKPRFVAGAIGPTNKTISVTQNITFEELEESYFRQAKALVEGGVDLLIVETVFDTLNAKAVFSALNKLFQEVGDYPILLSCTIEQNGTMLAGQDIESFYTSMAHHNVVAIGMNCAVGPDLMKDHLRTLSRMSNTNILCYPNAGLPLDDGSFPMKPIQFAELIGEFIDNNWVNIVGGCCGTTKEHIAELSKVIDHSKLRLIPSISQSACSGMETLVVDEDNRPVIVGERTNVIGSRKFKELIIEEKFDIATEVGRKQVEKGAQVLDVCLANPDRDELEDNKRFFDIITKKVRVPIMIDSTDSIVIEESLKRCQGKCIINSVNFEDGLERCEQVLPLVKKYGAALIFGTIDEDKEEAMATTAERKLEIAVRAHDYVKGEWGIPAEDIIFDPLVFPIATGDEKYVDSAEATIEAIRSIKKQLPKCKTILGVSNVSFGLPSAGREVLNSVYLYHATKAGLDFAIVNSEKLVRYASISSEEKKLANDLLFNSVKDPITPLVEFYRGKKVQTTNVLSLPLNERLPLYIIEGRKEGLVVDLNEALKSSKPLEIINGPLMEGMGVVGKLFNDNKLIVSEVLQSAESMKVAVAHLETFMDKSNDAKQGKVMIATVKGDVHDIGKNLLEIILSNNGYEVFNLGIKVPPDKLIEGIKKHNPDVIGLSGLLVKSAHMMVNTVQDFRSAGVTIPVMVGGAALSEKFTATKISSEYQGIVAYSADAMEGLQIVRQIITDYDLFKAKNDARFDKLRKDVDSVPPDKEYGDETKSKFIKDHEMLTPKHFEQEIIDGDLEEIFSYLNPQRLYCMHLGLDGNYHGLLKIKDAKLIKLVNQVEEVKGHIIKNQLLKPKGIFRFFECNSEKNNIEFYGDEAVAFQFKRQAKGDGLCVADFIADKKRGKDVIGILVTTSGAGVVEKSRELREQGQYLKSHLLQIIAVEVAEAFSEIIHKKMRELLGISEDLNIDELLNGKYQGVRLQFGYPACPNMEDQEKLFNLLKPDRIGVTLTELNMMEPEASVSSLVFYHPQAQEFNL